LDKWFEICPVGVTKTNSQHYLKGYYAQQLLDLVTFLRFPKKTKQDRFMNSNYFYDTHVTTQKIYVLMKLKFTIRKDLIGKEGTTPIYLNVTSIGERERINTHLQLAKNTLIFPN